MNGMPKFWWGGYPPIPPPPPPPGSATAYTMKIIYKRRPKGVNTQLL